MYAVSADSKGLDTVVGLLADVVLHPRLTGVALWLGGQEELWKGCNFLWGGTVRARHSCVSHWRVLALRQACSVVHNAPYFRISKRNLKGFTKVLFRNVPHPVCKQECHAYRSFSCVAGLGFLLGGSRREQQLVPLLSFTAAWPHGSS